ncbi:Arc family DNA-binding protein [Xanthomonas citri]|uniref:Arc family DNA-binding protein n=1 Tax=Xanthomonas citri TaxID=346 RepID=UPI0001CECEC6|nr:hypothetical protein TP37_15985 [Xanthomonas citri pv. aurantifolii]EFF49130.1 hypothetical protein XAUC_04880 [Xanthomonas citri pv. aurantifolii str. ICPB 10535]TBW97221.1 hypothetical protein TP47_11990 [Xanthomonas citri pv. aurantifolii]TBX05339.1 hypothetical protein TP46_00265 [Xanthomonas citri pv. aurantifolii]
MSRADPQLNIRLPAALKERVTQAAATASRSVSAEVSHRLEQSFAAAPSSAAQHELALPLPAAVLADQVTAARNVFESVLAVAERMRVDRPTAIARALQSALKRTGVDLAQELAPAADDDARFPGPSAGPPAQFLVAWRDGTLALPWAPTLLTDAHAAFRLWCAQRDAECIPANHFSRVLGRSGGIRHQRKRWRADGIMTGPAAFLVPGRGQPLSKRGFEVDWYGACVVAFRNAARAAGLAACSHPISPWQR